MAKRDHTTTEMILTGLVTGLPASLFKSTKRVERRAFAFTNSFRPYLQSAWQSPRLLLVRPELASVRHTSETPGDVTEVAFDCLESTAAPEFNGNVVTVESYKVYDLIALEVFKKGWQNHFAEWCAVGSDRPYHYLGSGKFFVRFGDALATATAELIEKQ